MLIAKHSAIALGWLPRIVLRRSEAFPRYGLHRRSNAPKLSGKGLLTGSVLRVHCSAWLGATVLLWARTPALPARLTLGAGARPGGGAPALRLLANCQIPVPVEHSRVSGCGRSQARRHGQRCCSRSCSFRTEPLQLSRRFTLRPTNVYAEPFRVTRMCNGPEFTANAWVSSPPFQITYSCNCDPVNRFL